jgi:hypothetical protein
MDEDETVTASCGCVFCDLDLAVEYVDGKPMHAASGRTIDGIAAFVPCPRSATVAVIRRK